MPRKISLVRTTIAVFLVIIIVIALHWLGWLKPIESGLGYVIEPMAKGARFVSNKIGNSISLLGRISELESENFELAKKLEKVQAENGKLKDDKAELAALRESLNISLPKEIKTTAAKVIGHDSISGTKTMIIDKGTKDGLKEGMAVISNTGILIGRIKALYAGQAEVLLLADDRSAIPSRISESRSTGITRGELGLGLKMTDIPQQDTINVDDQVVTSGLGGDLPAGLSIGSIEAVESSANALFQIARIRPYAEVSKIEIVFIINEF